MRNKLRSLLCSSLLACAFLPLTSSVCAAEENDKPLPAFKNISYGPHERNVLDFWKCDSDEPTPLVVYIHGGGFRNGSKESIHAETLKALLKANISVAALNYRLIAQAPLPAAHYDCRRGLQFLRSQANSWNLDKTRVGAFGGSAEAQLCMYLAFHDEMAKPDSDDPIERESTRLNCVATHGGQTTMDVQWWKEHVPDYESAHRNFFETFGAETQEDYLKKVVEVSALSLITKDDPPIFMSYIMPPDEAVPSDPRKARGWKIHHVVFGIELQKKMKLLGIEADLNYPGAKSTYQSGAKFFIAKLTKPTTPK